MSERRDQEMLSGWNGTPFLENGPASGLCGLEYFREKQMPHPTWPLSCFCCSLEVKGEGECAFLNAGAAFSSRCYIQRNWICSHHDAHASHKNSSIRWWPAQGAFLPRDQNSSFSSYWIGATVARFQWLAETYTMSTVMLYTCLYMFSQNSKILVRQGFHLQKLVAILSAHPKAESHLFTFYRHVFLFVIVCL